MEPRNGTHWKFEPRCIVNSIPSRCTDRTLTAIPRMHLRKNRVPWDIEKFWIGHANEDVTDKYAAESKEDLEWRKDVTKKNGLGFALPPKSEISNGQLGQSETSKSEEAKAA